MVLVGGVVFVLGVVAAVENGLVQGLGWHVGWPGFGDWTGVGIS